MRQSEMFTDVPALAQPASAPDFSGEITGKWVAAYADSDGDSLFIRVSESYQDDAVDVEVTEIRDFREYSDDLATADGVFNINCSSWTFPRGSFDLVDMQARNHAMRAVASNGVEPDGAWLPEEEAQRFTELTLLMNHHPQLFAQTIAPEYLRGWQDIHYTAEKLEKERAHALTWYNWSYARRGECLTSYYGGDEPSYRSMFPSLRAAMNYENIGRDALPAGEHGDRIWNDAGPDEWGDECRHTHCCVYPRERHIRFVAAACGQALIKRNLATAAHLLTHLRKLANKLDADYVWSSERPEWWDGSKTRAALVGYAQLVPENEI